ncbi:MAG: ArsR/SmtB family transcription factor, partial [Candidatus Hodarchaeota archaeon]
MEKIEALKTTLSKKDFFTLSHFFQILSGETRLKILAAVSESELCVNHLAEILDVSVSAVSHQLRELKSVQMVS